MNFIKHNKYYILLLLFYIFLSLFLTNSNNNTLVGDSRENLNIAFNLYKDNSFAYTVYENEQIKSNFREPLYPFLLSIFIGLLPFEFNTFNDLIDKTKYLKIINIFFLIILSLSLLIIIRDLRLKKTIEFLIIFFIFLVFFFHPLIPF